MILTQLELFVFYKEKDEVIKHMFIEEGIVMGSHGENPPLMKTRRKMKIDDARFFWVNFLNQGWQKTNPKW